MPNTFKSNVTEYQKNIDEISNLINQIIKIHGNRNANFFAINQLLCRIDEIKSKIYTYIDTNLKTIEKNPDYIRYQTAQDKYIAALQQFETILSDPMPMQR